MYSSKIRIFAIICVYVALFPNISFQENNETITVKKNLKELTADTSHLLTNISHSQHTNVNNQKIIQNNHPRAKIFFPRDPDDAEIPESFKMGFYFIIALSIAAILFILLKINRMRLSRAERKYGVHGDRTTQELTPLPMAIEDDSENEDHTLFDIKRQMQVS